MSDRAPLLRAVHKVRIARRGKHRFLKLRLACGHSTERQLAEPTCPAIRCLECERIRAQHLAAEPLPFLRLTHYGL